MFRWLILLLIALTIAMIVCVRILDRNLVKNLAKNRKTVVHLIWNAVFTVVCYTVFLLIPPWYERAAAFASSFYYIATDWLVVHLVLFCVSYTRREYAARLPRRLIGMLAGADSASLLINPFTHHMYRLNLSGPGGWGTSCWEIQVKLPHVAHRVFVYALAAYSLFLLFSRMLQVPDIYKRKYGSILLHTLMVLVINLICLALHTRYDYSVILYASLAMVISYLVMYATPRILLERIVGTVVEDSFIGLFAYDKDGHCVETNQIARELLAVEGDIQAAAEAYLARWKEEHGDEDSPAGGEEQVLERDGKKLYLYITYQKFLDAKGRLQGSCFRFEDRTQMVEKFQEEQYKASHDLLTGLLNRSAFEQRVRQILSEATEPYCMLSTNIKDFKLINELYGAEVGDRLLIAQAQEIQKVAVEESVSARLYADRFCSLIPRRCFQEDHITEHMAVVVEQGPGKAFRLHYYIGVYDIVDVDEPVWTMYDKASMAIETIRGDYEKFISYYREEVMQHMMEEKEVLGDFDKALAERQFQMYLQPQIDRNGDTVGAEALVRWAHPGKGMVNPALFIPALERAGLIYRLDLYMWENAAERLQEWKRQGWEDLSIAVNISAKDFFYIDVCQSFRRLMDKYDFCPKNLKLEITESALMENMRENMKTLDGLHELGFDIELDDFGTGYSSLGMLKDVHADILKLDMVFLRDTQNADRNKVILKNIIAMADDLGMAVISEGVETQAQVDFLRQMGCDMFQGFYFAKPMSVEEFEKNLRQRALTRRENCVSL